MVQAVSASVCYEIRFPASTCSSYQEFDSVDLENYVYSVRLFAEKEMWFILAQSFAKNIGLYGERIGTLQ